MATQTLPPELRLSVCLMLAARWIASTASTMVTPYLVLILHDSAGMSLPAATMAASLVFVGGRLFARPLGQLADRYPQAPLMTACLLTSAASTALLAHVRGPYLVILGALACVGLSLSGASFTVMLRAHIGRRFDKELLTTLYSWSSVAFNLGMVVGASMAGLCMQFHMTGSIIAFASTLHVVAAGLILCFTARPSGDRRAVAPTPGSVDPHSRVVAAGVLGIFASASGVLGYLATNISLSLAVYADRFMGNAALASLFFSTQSLALIVLLPVAGAAARRFRRQLLFRLYFGGLFMAAVGYCVFGLLHAAPAGLAISALAICFCVSQLMAMPTADPLMSAFCDKQALGRAMGTTTSAGAVGSALACLCSGLALALTPPHWMWLLWTVPGLLSAVILAFLYRVGRQLVHREDERTSPDISRAMK
jgi:MFS family permease